MTRHPCFICDDVGSFRHGHERIACDCPAGQRLSPVPTYFSVKNQYEAASDGTPTTHPVGSPAAIPAPMPTSPTRNSITNTADMNQLVTFAPSMEG